MKPFIIYTLLSLILLSVQSQDVGVRFGVNYSSLYPGTGEYTAGLKAGFFDKFYISKNLDLQIELDYINLGAKNNEEQRRVFNTHYIYVPVTMAIKIDDFNIQWGIYGARMFNASNTHKFLGNNFNWPVEDWGDYHRLYDYGLIFGAGYYMQTCYLEAHGMMGREVNGPSVKPHENIYGAKNRAIDLSLYVPFKTFK
jgi:hypothetical protein